MNLAREEVLIRVQARNNRLYNLIVDRGFIHKGKPNMAMLGRTVGISNTTIGKLLNLKENPFCEIGRHAGQYTPSAQKIAEYFKVSVSELFPRELYDTIANSKTSKAIMITDVPYVHEMIKAHIGGNELSQCVSGTIIPLLSIAKGV